MKLSTIAIVSMAVAMPVMASGMIDPQDLERRDGAVVAADYNYKEIVVSSCAISSAGSEAVLSATVKGMPVHSGIVTGAGPGAAPHVRHGG